MAKRVLVTGASGFLGSHLCGRLAAQGVKVVAFVQKKQSAPKKATAFEGDILTPDDLLRAAKGCDVVFHLAGQSTPRVAEENPALDFDANVLGTLNALSAAEKCGAKSFVFTSSSFVYGNAEGKKPLKETAECKPAKIYGLDKLAAEEHCRLFARKGKMRVAIARLFNVYGPGQKGRVVSDLIGKARAEDGKKTFEVLGNCADWRDMLFVDDAVGALVLLAQKGKSGEAYNVASGKAVEIKALAEKIAKVSKAGKNPACAKFDRTSAFGMAASVSKIRRLGWAPKIPLEKGLEKCVEGLR
ncbi:MAG: NAD(P)-dependent oxidoreductase [Candidatus Micrarchaeia archaeon]